MSSAPSPAYSAASERAEQFYAVIKSIREFDRQKLTGILQGLINPTEREQCFLATYYRAAGNIESLLVLNGPKHFQAAAMLARALYELAVDIKLIDKIAGGWARMVFFIDVEKFRTARKMIEFAAANPDLAVDVIPQTEFVKNNENRIAHNRRILWPPKSPTAKPRELKHWSGHDLSQRARLLGEPFNELYNSQYPRLSWYVHSGLTGVLYQSSEFFPMVHGYALSLSMSCYSIILETVIREMKIHLADAKILDTLKYATLLPFAKTPEEEAMLFRGLLE
jgi:hypothetical protein